MPLVFFTPYALVPPDNLLMESFILVIKSQAKTLSASNMGLRHTRFQAILPWLYLVLLL
jgi:hypothetical protein